MHVLMATGLGSYSGGFHASEPAHCLCLLLCGAGGFMLGLAWYHLRKVPEPRDLAVPAASRL